MEKGRAVLLEKPKKWVLGNSSSPESDWVLEQAPWGNDHSTKPVRA